VDKSANRRVPRIRVSFSQLGSVLLLAVLWGITTVAWHAHVDNVLMNAICNQDAERVEEALDSGANPNIYTASSGAGRYWYYLVHGPRSGGPASNISALWNTLYSPGARSGSPATVTILGSLVRHRCNVDESEGGCPTIVFAAQCCHPRIIREILAGRPIINARCGDQTALMVITLRIFDPDSVDADQIAAMLIAAHADTKLRDRYGKTAKEIADRTQVPISVRRQLSLRLMLPFHTLNGP